MLVVLAMMYLVGPRGDTAIGRRARNWVVSGIVVSWAGVAVQASGYDVHRYLGHNELYHLIQAVGIYCVYRGAWLFP